MFNGLYTHTTASDAELATRTLGEEASYKFPSFTASDAVTLGLSIRKRFRASSRHALRNRGLVISIQTIAGHVLFSCTVGDLGGPSSIGDVSLDSWACLEGMINVVRRTGHSSFYIEKGISAIGKTPHEMGILSDYKVVGGAFPIWLQNSPCCPIGIVAAYGGSSVDDHRLVVTSIRDYLNKMSLKAQEQMPVNNEIIPPAENMEQSDKRSPSDMYVNENSPFVPNEYGD